jgi:hypothetical protein
MESHFSVESGLKPSAVPPAHLLKSTAIPVGYDELSSEQYCFFRPYVR